MLSYFPQIYPEELLYSVLARYHRHVGAMCAAHTVDDLFGRPVVSFTADLQNALGALCERIPPGRGLTPQRLARDCTLYPYYSTFQPKAVAEAVLCAVIDGPARGVHLRLGIASGAVSKPACLRFCPACRAGMLQAHGELYWRRDHQLPGVLICPHHGVPLLNSTVRLQGTGRRELVAAHLGNCGSDDLSEPWTKEACTVALLHRIACSSALLLTAPHQCADFGSLMQEYRVAASERGFGNMIRIDQEKLAAAYAQTFAPVMRLLPAADSCRGANWLAAITQRQNTSFHPLRHVLFRLFLEELPVRPPPTPFGEGPWPCLNRLAAHHGQRVVVQLTVLRRRGRTIGRFSCSCGHVYSLAEGAKAKPRTCDYGPLFDERLRHLMAAGLSVGAAASALGVFPSTVAVHAARLALVAPGKSRPPKPSHRARKRDAIRSRWLAVQMERPGLSRTELRRLLAGEHTWLRRHDKDWLDMHFPPPRKPEPPVRRVDWPALDCGLAAALTEKAASLNREHFSRRITLAELERQLGMPRWIRSRMGKLPRTAAALALVAETIEAFYLRRIAWAVAELDRQKLPVQPWRVRALAGLTFNVSPIIKAALREIVTAYNGNPEAARCGNGPELEVASRVAVPQSACVQRGSG